MIVGELVVANDGRLIVGTASGIYREGRDAPMDYIPGSVVEADSLALVALYESTGGPNWFSNRNWLEGPV